MNLNEKRCYALSSEEAEKVLNGTTLMDLMRSAKSDEAEKIVLSGYSNARAVYVLGNPKVIRILDNLIREL